MSDDVLDALLDNAESQIQNVLVMQILQDLLAELRALHPLHPTTGDACDTCTAYGEYSPGRPVDYDDTTMGFYPCPTLLALDRAEARLREVTE